MSFKDKAGAKSEVGEVRGSCEVNSFADGPRELGPGELDEALRDFRLSVHAWSAAAYSRPRTAVVAVRRRIWRLAAGWALGCVLVAGSVSGGIYEHHHRQQLARIAAARAAEQQRQVDLARANQEEEDLLAKVDSDVSREVPSAMEPLAQLMADDETR